ncbi:MAG TPA: M23 family metallopeptidase [Jatrophihabitans sp.]|jgi:murein DD-endopeptidase MepM/ murein hydrolase activator NlpD|uniref:murein hydrolase activator EnvC family protein n=1 Tax=Jatrophihabitans sp. TaxID=1932789 RepID=UPI002E087DB4|nr:M23 family metallopeptidase [Jatrophihabitans sp.]
MSRTVLALLLAAGVLAPVAHAPARAPRVGAPALVPASSAVLTYVAPLTGPLRVLRPFDPPATPYGPGHRGVDLAAAVGAAVRSAGPGVVTFAGSVAGRGVLVVVHPDGIRTEYEPVDALVPVGASVRGGQVVGRISGGHRGCAPQSCLHWGARRGPVYLDPLTLLRPLAPVRLLPWPRPG